MLRYTILLTATLCAVLFSEMAANERLTFWVANEISEPHSHLKADCQACHEPWKGPSRARCIACHALAALDRQSTESNREPESGPGSSIQMAAAGDEHIRCAQCHQEHMGLPKLLKANLSVTRVHLVGHPMHGTCANCHAKVDHGRVLSCAFCHMGDPTKTTKAGSHAGMKAE